MSRSERIEEVAIRLWENRVIETEDALRVLGPSCSRWNVTDQGMSA